MTAQLALALDPADALELGHAAKELDREAADLAARRRAKRCRCARGPMLLANEDCEARCALCGRAAR